jgi:hypothetical protein
MRFFKELSLAAAKTQENWKRKENNSIEKENHFNPSNFQMQKICSWLSFFSSVESICLGQVAFSFFFFLYFFFPFFFLLQGKAFLYLFSELYRFLIKLYCKYFFYKVQRFSTGLLI